MSTGGSGGGSSTQTQKLDPWLKQQIGQNLSTIQGLEGYQAYPTEQAIAGFTPEMQQQMQQMQQMGQQGYGLMNQGADTLQNVAGITPQQVSAGQADLSQFQNPYQQQVVDQTINDLDRARQMAVGQTEDQAIASGAFGGSRQAIVEGETNRGFADRTAAAVGQLNQQGYNTALQAAQNQQGMDMAAQQANQSAGLDAGRLQMLAGQGLLGAGQGMVGQGQQAAQMGQSQEQAMRDFAFQQYQQAFQDPRILAQMESSAIQGIPMIGTSSSSQSGGSGLGNAIGGASSGAAMGGMLAGMSGGAVGGPMGMAVGGGLGLLGGMFG